MMNGRIWIKAQSMEHLALLKKKLPHTSIVAGNTAISIDRLFKKEKESNAFIHAPHCLNREIRISEDSLIIGSTATLTDLDYTIKGKLKPFSIFKTLRDSIKSFGNEQIRNVATMSGNICTSSHVSDIIPILMASRSTVSLISTKNTRKLLIDSSFFPTYKKNLIESYEVINYFKIPINRENQYIRFYKQSKRKKGDCAVINSCFFVELSDDGKIKELRIVFGGVAPRIVEAVETSNDLVGMEWDRIMLEKACIKLMKELYVSKVRPGGEEIYRNNLILSLFFKFYLDICQMFSNEIMIKENQHISGISLFDTISDNTSVGKPLLIPSALKHATGQSQFISDIPKFKNEVVVYPITAAMAPATFQIENFEDALKLPGIVDIISFDNWDYVESSFLALSPGLQRKEYIIANEQTIYSGQPIVYIVAEKMSQALDASRVIKIKYQLVSDPIVTIEDAIEKGSFHETSFESVISVGNVNSSLEVVCYSF